MTLDFEKALIKALKLVFKQVQLRGCLFHLAQSFFRHLVECGFKREYSENLYDVKRFFNYCVAIAYLPTQEITPAWFRIKAMRPFPQGVAGQEVQYFNMTKFIEYIEHEYYGVSPTFSKSMTSLFTRDNKEYTNNGQEGYHNGLKQLAYPLITKGKPNFFQVVQLFRDDEARGRASLRQFLGGAAPEKSPRRQYKSIQDKLNRQKEILLNALEEVENRSDQERQLYTTYLENVAASIREIVPVEISSLLQKTEE